MPRSLLLLAGFLTRQWYSPRVSLELMRQHRVNLVRMACWCLTELAAELFASTPHFAGACMQCGEQGPFIKARSSVERADDAVMGL